MTAEGICGENGELVIPVMFVHFPNVYSLILVIESGIVNCYIADKFTYKSKAENKNEPYFYDLFMIIRYRLQSTFQSVFLYRPVCATMDTRDERY